MLGSDWPTGRLGLFHYQKRIISTLKKAHVHYFDAITDLLAALYGYHPDDYARLLSALKDGSLSKKGTKYTSSDITSMKGTRLFRDRYAKYLRKQMHPHETIIQMLDDWFCKYKVTSSIRINRDTADWIQFVWCHSGSLRKIQRPRLRTAKQKLNT